MLRIVSLRPRHPLRAKSWFALAASLALVPTSALAQQTPLIPRELLLGNPECGGVRISPDGELIAFLAPRDGVMNLWVRQLNDTAAAPVTTSTDRPVRDWWWAANSDQLLYLLDENGDENFHLHVTTIDYGADLGREGEVMLVPVGGTTRDLTPFEKVQARLLAQSPDFPDQILITINERERRFHDVWRIDTRTGAYRVVYENDRGYYSFLAGTELNLRAGLRATSSGGVEADIRDLDDGRWYALASWNAVDATNSRPLGFSADGRTVFIADSRQSDRARLYAFQEDEAGNLSYVPIADHPVGELSEVLFHHVTGLPIAVQFERSVKQWIILDDRYLDDFRRVHEETQGHFRITSRDYDDVRWVVEAESDTQPLAWYLYDRRTGRAELLYESRPGLRRFELASTEAVTIKSRDGLEMVGYLTRPVRSARRRQPMVLLVHGGPWSRDHWGFNAKHQWLANRGYVVLSVNFRGSTGFGKTFTAAGHREWAGAMHNDLIDACLWAIEARIADESRIAIMGSSYGGYAALVGLTFTPDFFAAGIDIVGPSNLNTLLGSIPEYWEPRRALFEARIGPLDRPEYLASISPITRVDEIRKPLLVVQGGHDPRVKQQESEQIVNAMRERDLPVTYVLFPDEGHGLRRAENELACAAIAELFLTQHLGGRAERVGDAIARSSAQVNAADDLMHALE